VPVGRSLLYELLPALAQQNLFCLELGSCTAHDEPNKKKKKKKKKSRGMGVSLCIWTRIFWSYVRTEGGVEPLHCV
jgi:hypothetical protein